MCETYAQQHEVMSFMDVCINACLSQSPLNTSNLMNLSEPNTLIDSATPINCGDVAADLSNVKNAKKGSKKVKSNKSQWRKEKGNKYLNKPYMNCKGVEVKSKEFVDYDCKCQLKCREILTANERKQEFQKFWELGTYEAQAIFLIARVDEHVTKKSTKKPKKAKKDEASPSENEEKKSKRQYSRTYILKSKQVCRNMFVKTLGITSKRINTALVKMRARNVKDERGVSQGGKNKISKHRYDEVVDHIQKMPRYKCSHLQGKFNPEYLPPELSLSKMYDLYSKETENPVSLSMYKKIYYGKFNFKTKGLKKEICNVCKVERKVKHQTLRKPTREKQPYLLPNPVEEQPVMHNPYRAGNFMPPAQMNCNPSWLPPPNFQMPQHSAAHFFEQHMGYE